MGSTSKETSSSKRNFYCKTCKSYTEVEIKQQWLRWKDALERNAEAQTEFFGQSTTHGSHKTSTREEVRALCHENNDLNSALNQLKDLVPVLLREVSEQRHEVKSLLQKNEEWLKMGVLMLVANLFILVIVLAVI